jgi:hypothetical protein
LEHGKLDKAGATCPLFGGFAFIDRMGGKGLSNRSSGTGGGRPAKQLIYATARL